MYKFYNLVFVCCFFIVRGLCAQEVEIAYDKLEDKIAQLTEQVEHLIQLQEPKPRTLIKTLKDFIFFLKEAVVLGLAVVVSIVGGRIIVTLYSLYDKIVGNYKIYVIDKVPQKVKDFYFAHQDNIFI